MYYTDSEIDGLDEDSLLIHRWSGTEWQALSSCTIDKSANSLSCPTSQFSVYALLGTAPTSESGGSSSSTSTSNSGTNKPRKPDVKSGTGGNIDRGDITTIIEPDSIMFDVQLDATIIPNSLVTQPKSLVFHSPIYFISFKDYHNGAAILPSVQFKSSILAIHYSLASAMLNPLTNKEKMMKIAYSPDQKTWSILNTSVVDSNNHTVAALTKPYGYYALVTGSTKYESGIHSTLGISKNQTQDVSVKDKEKKTEYSQPKIENKESAPKKESIIQKVIHFVKRALTR